MNPYSIAVSSIAVSSIAVSSMAVSSIAVSSMAVSSIEVSSIAVSSIEVFFKQLSLLIDECLQVICIPLPQFVGEVTRWKSLTGCKRCLTNHQYFVLKGHLRFWAHSINVTQDLSRKCSAWKDFKSKTVSYSQLHYFKSKNVQFLQRHVNISIPLLGIKS